MNENAPTDAGRTGPGDARPDTDRNPDRDDARPDTGRNPDGDDARPGTDRISDRDDARPDTGRISDRDDARPDVRRAHAKLTVHLRITGVRDDGYHLIDAEMVSLDLHDVLTIDPAGDGVDAIGPFADGVPTDRSNLVARVLERVGRRAHVTIDKRIPHGGGLGGGSTDAAAVLRWAGVGTSPAELRDAASLGADIPFCLVGGRARVGGIGEIVEPMAPVAATYTLIIPPLGVSTPAAYRAWDELGGPTGEGRNDLEPAALVVEPRLAWWRDAIGERVGAPPVLAGSGATWFVEGRRDDALADLVDEGARIVVTDTRGVDAGD